MGGEPMTQSEIELRIRALEQQVAALLSGSVAKKTVNGREYFYRRWTENKKRREKYIPMNQVEAIRSQVEQRKALADPAKKLRKRECFQQLHDFIYGGRTEPGVYPLRTASDRENDTDPSDFC